MVFNQKMGIIRLLGILMQKHTCALWVLSLRFCSAGGVEWSVDKSDLKVCNFRRGEKANRFSKCIIFRECDLRRVYARTAVFCPSGLFRGIFAQRRRPRFVLREAETQMTTATLTTTVGRRELACRGLPAQPVPLPQWNGPSPFILLVPIYKEIYHLDSAINYKKTPKLTQWVLEYLFYYYYFILFFLELQEEVSVAQALRIGKGKLQRP